MFEQLSQAPEAPISFVTLLINMGTGIILAFFLRWHFKRYSSTLSNHEEFSMVFPFILLTTLLIITVVKSSLALSLGLVGALSIVRFRTPIKEPEELAYLFVAIAMGLGLGANQTEVTILSGLIILGVMAVVKSTRHKAKTKNLFLSIDWLAENQGPQPSLETLTEVLGKHTVATDLRRFDARAQGLEATFFVDLDGSKHISTLVDELKSRFPQIGITFIDQNQLPSV